MANWKPPTWSFPRPCSRRLRAIRWACSLVLSRLILNAMRNFRAPVTVAPQLGTKELGPKSGIHSACVSCGNIHPGVRRRGPYLPTLPRVGEMAPSHTPATCVGEHLLRQGLILSSPDGRQGLTTGRLSCFTVEIHCKETQAVRCLAG